MNRRDFLSSVAVVPALAFVRRQQPPAAKPGPHGLKLGTVTYNIAKDWDVPTIIKNLTEAGFEAVELRTTHKHGVEITLTPAQRAEVRKQFEASPIKIGGLGTTCEFHAADPAVVRKNIDETKEWIKLAKDLGSPSVKVRPNGLVKEVPEEKTLEQIGKSLAECATFAGDNGIKIQLEVHGSETQRVPRIRKIFDYAGNPSDASCVLELKPDGSAGRRLRRELSAAQESDRPDPHARSDARRVSLAQADLEPRGDEVPGVLLRRDSRVDRSGSRAEVFPRNVQGVSGTLTRHP